MSKKSTKKSVKRTVKSVKKPSQKPASKSTKVVKTAKPIKVAGAVKSAKSVKTVKAPKFRSPHGRADGNPFREGSSYAVAFDCLAHAGSEGITRGQLITEVAKATGKDERHAGYDVAVLLSAKENGERHSSCRSGFWVERVNDHLKLHVTASAPTTGN